MIYIKFFVILFIYNIFFLLSSMQIASYIQIKLKYKIFIHSNRYDYYYINTARILYNNSYISTSYLILKSLLFI